MSKKKKFKKSLTQNFNDIEASCNLFNHSIKTIATIKNAKEKKPRYHPNYYKKIFVSNYEEYYRNGGRVENPYYDTVYFKMTGKKFDKNIKRKKR